MVVQCRVAASRRSKISASPRTSSCAVGSPSSTTPAPSLTAARALATATLCHWPPDRSLPPLYPRARTVSRAARLAAPADSATARPPASGAPALARRRPSRIAPRPRGAGSSSAVEPATAPADGDHGLASGALHGDNPLTEADAPGARGARQQPEHHHIRRDHKQQAPDDRTLAQ